MLRSTYKNWIFFLRILFSFSNSSLTVLKNCTSYSEVFTKLLCSLSSCLLIFFKVAICFSISPILYCSSFSFLFFSSISTLYLSICSWSFCAFRYRWVLFCVVNWSYCSSCLIREDYGWVRVYFAFICTCSYLLSASISFIFCFNWKISLSRSVINARVLEASTREWLRSLDGCGVSLGLKLGELDSPGV